MQGNDNKRLTLTPKAALDWSREGTPASETFGDIYFSIEGGLEETREVYLKACGLPQAWDRPRNHFTIAELGFGTGLNFLATWQLWDKTAYAAKHLHFVSIEKFPLDKAALEKALAFWPELALWSKQLLAQWPGRVRGIHRLEFKGVTLTLIHDDVVPALETTSFRANAWYLDGFSPARNPDMWSPDILGRIGALSAGGAKIGTFTAAGAVRQGLAQAGYEVRKVEGFGRKRHRIEAIMPETEKPDPPTINPLIIGGGIAGASLARSFLRRGITPTLIDAGDDSAASANPAAIVKPRLDRQDKPDARFFLSSYLFALQVYRKHGAVLKEGVFHAAKDEAFKARFQDLASRPSLPETHMNWQGGAFGTEGLYFPKALIIDPVKTVASFKGRAAVIKARVSDVKASEAGWDILGEAGDVIASASHVFCALGAGIKQFPLFQDLGLRFSRGQLTWAKGSPLDMPISYGGYAIPTEQGLLLGATHDRIGEGGDIYKPREEDDIKNLAGYSAISGEEPVLSGRSSRVSVRVNTAQTWPIRYDFGGGLWGISGLGSRGFVSAPLLADSIVSQLCGEPSPMESGLFLKELARKKAP